MIHMLDQFAELWGASLWRAAWQGAIAIAAAGAIHRWCTFLSPRVVCWVWRLACLKLLVALFWIPPVELAFLPVDTGVLPAGQTVSQVMPMPEAASRVVAEERDSLPRPQPEPAPGPAPESARIVVSWPILLLPVWLLGVVYCIGRTAQQWRSIRQLVQGQGISATDHLLRIFQEEGVRLGIRRLPRLQFSSQVESPLLVGVWRPSIILPEKSDTAFTDHELRMMLAHELAHLKRHDLVWNWLPTVATWLFYFHPLVWAMVRRWSEVQEAACDELLIQRCATDPAAYGRLLVKLSALFSMESNSGHAAVGVLGSYRNLERRILTMARVRPFSARYVTIAACLLSMIAAIAMVPWQLVAQGPSSPRQAETIAPTAEAQVEQHAETRQDLGKGKEVDMVVELDESPKVVIANPQSKTVDVSQQYVAKIHSHRHIQVRALEKGYIESVPLKEGQAVKKGDRLFNVRPILYQKKVDAKNAEAKLAQLQLKYTQKLADDKVVSQDEVDLRKVELDMAQANADLAKAELDFATVKAPFDGIIDRLRVQGGSLVQEGDVLTTMSDNSVMWVYFNVPEARYLEDMADPDQHNEDRQIELVLANGKKFSQVGKLGAIEADFNDETGAIPYRADFPNPNRLLRHGQSGTVLIHRVLKDAIVIPQRATFEVLNKRYVFVVDKDNVAHQREIGIQNEVDDIFVINTGVGVDDKIVVDGIRRVRDGEKVEF
ncbi:MAG TPA: efflux RND transporter periplasmic adaptor subunit [Pirellulales bacterium]|jgi:membrane fusion protein (multidrug efflux system)